MDISFLRYKFCLYYYNNLKKSPKLTHIYMKTTNHIDSGIILQSIPLLSDLPAKELKCFKNNTILKYYKKGTLIESEMKNNLCVIWKGRVEVFRNENNTGDEIRRAMAPFGLKHNSIH